MKLNLEVVVDNRKYLEVTKRLVPRALLSEALADILTKLPPDCFEPDRLTITITPTEMQYYDPN